MTRWKKAPFGYQRALIKYDQRIIKTQDGWELHTHLPGYRIPGKVTWHKYLDVAKGTAEKPPHLQLDTFTPWKVSSI